MLAARDTVESRDFRPLILEAATPSFIHLRVFDSLDCQGEIMAGPAPKTRNWTARENAHKPKGLHVIVIGHVEVNSTDLEPHLKELSERDPKRLGLALTIGKTGGPGVDVKVWKLARFHKEVKANEYDSVTVRWDVTSIAQFPVIDDTEHHQHLREQAKALNAKYAGKRGPKGAAKPAAKKSAPKKAKKAAKKAPAAKKESAKKYAKKTKKKAAKKYGLKKLVRKLVKKLTPASKKKSKKR